VLPKKKSVKKSRESVNIPYYADAFVELVGKMYGETARKVLRHIIESGGSAPEETIGRDAGVKSNEARRILQKLGNQAVLTCRGKKVGEKVLHFWTINWKQVESFLINRLKKTREKLEILLKFEEENIIYECPVCGRKYTLDEAFDYEFKCPYDGEPLVEVERDKVIEFLKEKIREINEELGKLGA
jgi:transcription initiation factor TFIIE subunit alpha